MFMVSDEAELREAASACAASRLCFFSDATKSSMPLSDLWQLAFTVGERSRFRGWMSVCKHGDADEFFDLKDNPPSRAGRLALLPTMLTKSMVCSRARGGPLGIPELAGAMGFPPSLDMFWDLFARQSPPHQMQMLGNSIQLEMYALWVMFVLGNTAPREGLRLEALPAYDSASDNEWE